MINSLLYNYTTTLSSLRVLSWYGTPLNLGNGAKRNQKRQKDCKLLSSFELPFDQHSQLKAELGKHLLSGAIFLMLISLIARAT